MALIDCPECGKQISDKAASCIHCGNPLTQPAPIAQAQIDPDSVVTTQATSKPWKVIQAIGVVMMMVGIGSCVSGTGQGGFGTGGFALFTLGGVVTLTGKVGAWWSHG